MRTGLWSTARVVYCYCGPQVIAERFDDVTVLFVDVVGFTSLAASVSPERLVEILDELFKRFDELAHRHDVEKIKTIGDAYMAVAGLPEPRPDHAVAAAELAIAMKAAVADYGKELSKDLRVRIGMASGPVVAGVIGARKLAYDLWGETVNTAARMESHGLPGEIQVAASTYAKLRDSYCFEERGTIGVKGMGPMPTFLLRGAKLSLTPGATSMSAEDCSG